MEPKEVIIKLKNSEKSMRQTFLIYDEITASKHDPIIEGCEREACEAFGEDIESVKINIKLLDEGACRKKCVVAELEYR